MVTFCQEHLAFVKSMRDKAFVDAARSSKGWPYEVSGEIFRTDDGMALELKRLVATINGTRKVEAALVDELEQARRVIRSIEHGVLRGSANGWLRELFQRFLNLRGMFARVCIAELC